MSDNRSPHVIVAEEKLADAHDRVRFQHEFSLAGFRSLILINGGAIIALLTYAGNALDRQDATQLQSAFLWYVAGLVTTTAAYVFAYFSQGAYMAVTYTEAMQQLGLHGTGAEEKRKSERQERYGGVFISIGVLLVVASLLSFVMGSISAMNALTGPERAAEASEATE
ncbi:hypothetical protein NCF86_03390 [Pelagerythrobacter marinus]|nr:hypothetical protein NCF86_03390 [Pelagerythrobacter marinus]